VPPKHEHLCSSCKRHAIEDELLVCSQMRCLPTGQAQAVYIPSYNARAESQSASTVKPGPQGESQVFSWLFKSQMWWLALMLAADSLQAKWPVRTFQSLRSSIFHLVVLMTS
jgi:hypothetical protein